MPISLAEMDDVKLLNRIDKKYILPTGRVCEILEALQESYYILSIEDKQLFNYYTLYFDTPNHQFFRDHHNGLLNRVKVRCREYVDSNLTYFEVKRKFNGSRTRKFRERIDEVHKELEEVHFEQVRGHYQKHPFKTLEPKLHNYFQRITLVNKGKTERCTLDLGLNFRTPTGETARNEDIAILEIKQGKADIMSPVIQVLRAAGLHPCSISKYAYGMVLTGKDKLKHNNFKKLLHNIRKITRHQRENAPANSQTIYHQNHHPTPSYG